MSTAVRAPKPKRIEFDIGGGGDAFFSVVGAYGHWEIIATDLAGEQKTMRLTGEQIHILAAIAEREPHIA